MAPRPRKTYQVHLSVLGCAGITAERPAAPPRGGTGRGPEATPPAAAAARAVAVLSRRGGAVGTTPASGPLRQSPARGGAGGGGAMAGHPRQHRFLALWTEPGGPPSTITFKVDLPGPPPLPLPVAEAGGVGSAVHSAASSRLTSKDFELYIGVVTDDERTPAPIAAAILSLRAGMPSQMYDLPLYPVSDVDLAPFRSATAAAAPGGGREEKKDAHGDGADADPVRYGIDSLDALLRVQLTLEEYVPIKGEGIEIVTLGNKDDLVGPVGRGPTKAEGSKTGAGGTKESPKPVSKSPGGNPTFMGKVRQNLVRKPSTEERSRSVAAGAGEPTANPSLNLQSETSISITVQDGENVESCVSWKSDPAPYSSRTDTTGNDVMIEAASTRHDDFSRDDNTMGTRDGTVMSHETFQALRMQFEKVERFVERIALPECKPLDRLVEGRTFDEESTHDHYQESVAADTISNPFNKVLSRANCGALENVRDWLKSRDGSDDYDDFRSILSQFTRETAVTTEEPGPLSSDAVKGAPNSKKTSRSSLQSNNSIQMNTEIEESTVEATLNSFPIDERSSLQEDRPSDDTFDQQTVDDASDEESTDTTFPNTPWQAETTRENEWPPLDFFQCLGSSESKRAMDEALEYNGKLCAGQKATSDQALTKFIPKIEQALTKASAEGSPTHVTEFPGLAVSENKLLHLRSLFSLGNVEEVIQMPEDKVGNRPPVKVLKNYPDPDGDGSSIGELTLTTHEIQVEVERSNDPSGQAYFITQESSEQILPSPSFTFSSFFACSKLKSVVQNKDHDIDKTDPAVADFKDNVLSSELSAAAGLSWAKQNAELTNRRRSGRLAV